ncbi:hypothetical protein [Mucilaginibacter sp. UYCu711]|uniref:hypothetical protein n=1 Tax=Mucilaginibacter sp. UYCu711 TaxID=3156339 RepID=UPI003D218F1D
MKRLACFFVIILTTSCSTQQSLIKSSKFDIRKFELNKVNGEVNYTLKDGTTIRRLEYQDVFLEEIRKSNSAFTFRKSYFISTGRLKSFATLFYSFPVASVNEYNESGKLTKSTNFDKNYKFSIYDLAKKIKSEFKKDIMVSSLGLGVNRGYEKTPFYEVSILLGPSAKSNRRVIKVDGNNGNILSDLIQVYDDGAQ